MKKYITLAFAVILAAMPFIFTSCGGSSDARTIAQLQDSIATLNRQLAETGQQTSYSAPSNTSYSEPTSSYSSSSSSNGGNYVGTYKVTDTKGTTFYFILNADDTANVKFEGSDEVLYCTVHDWRNINKGIAISFSDERPIIYFEGGTQRYGTMHISDGWLYASSEFTTAKHPKWRLKAEKIN